MKWCPIAKSDCRIDCAWFRESRRKYKDHIEGECSLVEINHTSMKNIRDSITVLGQIINNKDFT